MEISRPQINNDGDHVIVSAEFNIGGETNSLWFKVEEKYRQFVVVERADAFLVGLLYFAMQRGEDIRIHAPVSEKLFYNLTTYLIPAIALANPRFSIIKVIPDSLESESINIQNAVGTGFSGGVDSFCTIVEHLTNALCPPHYRLSHLTFFNVGSHGDYGGATASELFNKRLQELKEFPHEVGLKFVSVDSNIADILQLNFAATHSLRSMAPVLLLQKLFRVYYYSSGYRMDDFRIKNAAADSSAYDILNMAMLATESTDLYSSGCQHTRVEKTAIIADYEPCWRFLNVCVLDKDNCSSCFKCMRTLLTLDIIGKIGNFAHVFDLALYQKNKNRYISEVLSHRGDYIMKDIYTEMQSRSFDVPIRSRYLTYRGKLLSPVKRLLYAFGRK
jgi:hypothetical protein